MVKIDRNSVFGNQHYLKEANTSQIEKQKSIKPKQHLSNIYIHIRTLKVVLNGLFIRFVDRIKKKKQMKRKKKFGLIKNMYIHLLCLSILEYKIAAAHNFSHLIFELRGFNLANKNLMITATMALSFLLVNIAGVFF